MANAAFQRGHVGQFDADEFGEALQIPAQDAAAIFAALEEPEIGWIAYDHIADFYDRNPDRDDGTAAERQRRKYHRDKGMKLLARLSRQGLISEAVRRDREAELLKGFDPQSLIAAWELVDTKSVSLTREDVRLTPEQSRDNNNRASVENSGDVARGEHAGLAMGAPGAGGAELEIAQAWLEQEGKQLLVDRIQIRAELAQTYLERWRRELGDDILLVKIIQGAEAVGHIGPRFHTIVTDQLRRQAPGARSQPALPLAPVSLPGSRAKTA